LELEGACREMSSKEVKSISKDKTKFDFKKKGEKPLITEDIIQFNITGSNFKDESILKVFDKHDIRQFE